MPIHIAWGNIQQDYPLHELPDFLINHKLRQLLQGNERIQRRQRSRWVAQFLLWQLLKKTSQKNTALLGQLKQTASGRPYFSQAQNLDFNISHSGDWVAVMLSLEEKENVVGIDIEAPSHERPFQALLAHFASPQEQQWQAQQHNPASAFYQIWCGREAILKSQGVGIVKLSEVRHNPALLQLHSSHCPVGQMIFTAELPFYLAAFSAGEALSQGQYWAWNGEQLAQFHPQHLLHYSVNH